MPLYLSTETCGKNCGILGSWYRHKGSTLLFFFTRRMSQREADCFVAHAFSVVEVAESAVGATLEVRRENVWDDTEGHNGGADRTAWQALLELEKYDIRDI